MQWIFLMNLYYQNKQTAFIRLYIYFNNFITHKFFYEKFIYSILCCLFGYFSMHQKFYFRIRCSLNYQYYKCSKCRYLENHLFYG